MRENSDLFKEKSEELFRLYHSFDGYEPEDISEGLFNEYYLTGQRIGYESAYFKKRGLLTAAAALFMIYGKYEYKNRLICVIKSVLREKTWALPAHVSCMEERPEQVIDLFSAETAQSLCEISALMPEAVDGDLYDKIKEAVRKRIIIPFESTDFAWERLRNNWAAVCGGCVGMVYLYMFPERFSAVRERILSALRCYISGFGDDGACAEGLLYWNLGFGYYLFFAQKLSEFDGTDIIHTPQIHSIAKFQQDMFMMNSYTVSFSDSGLTGGYNLGLTSFLADNFNDIYVPFGAERCDLDNCYRLAPFLRSFVWGRELKAAPVSCGEKYYRDAQWYISRQERFTVAAKCGNNNEPHNHNDVGSFIITDKSGQVLVDFGAGEYTADYFDDSKRYSCFAASSDGHNVPLVNGKPQKNGSEYFGEVLKHSDSAVVMDIGKAYDKNLSVIREIHIGGNSVEICDDGKGNRLKERFISFIKPVIENGKPRIGDWVMDACGEGFEVTECRVNNHEGEPVAVYVIEYNETRIFRIVLRQTGGDDKVD